MIKWLRQNLNYPQTAENITEKIKCGEISLLSLMKIALALEIQQELEELFEEVPFLSIEEIINGQD